MAVTRQLVFDDAVNSIETGVVDWEFSTNSQPIPLFWKVTAPLPEPPLSVILTLLNEGAVGVAAVK